MIVLASSRITARNVQVSRRAGRIWGFAEPGRRLGRAMLLQPASRSPFRLMALITALTIAAGVAPALAAPGSGPRPNLAAATAYLVFPAHLIGGHYYETVPSVADFGLTIDGALALAATRDN